jgi:hypothetical protein
MTDHDLARLLRDAVPDPPNRLYPDTVLSAARRRSLLRMTALGGTTAAAIIAGVAVFVAQQGSGSGTLIGSTPAPQPTQPLAACAVSSLRTAATGGGVISNGLTGATIMLTNTGKQPCHLPERITSLRSAKADADLPIEPTASDQGGPQDLAPGATVAFTIASVRVSGGSANCGQPAPTPLANPPVLAFTLPGTGEITVSLEAAVFTLGCWPIVTSRLFAAEPPSTASPAPHTTGPFLPTDVSFVSPAHGWAISPGRLMQTGDGGRTWSKVTAPPEYADHVRFASERVGYAWALRKDLYLTRDGGVSWQPAKLTHVLQLEASAGYVWALAGDEPYAGVWRGPVGEPSFTQVGRTPDRSGTLDVHGPYTYVVGEEGAGPIAGSLDVWVGAQRTNEPLPCAGKDLYIPFSPLGVSTDGTVFLVCDVQDPGNANSQRQVAYVSSDHGHSWTRTTAPSQPPTDVTATRRALFAWGTDVDRYDGTRWVVALHGTGFATVGFQDDDHGIALSRQGRLYLTRDGGMSWTTAKL